MQKGRVIATYYGVQELLVVAIQTISRLEASGEHPKAAKRAFDSSLDGSEQGKPPPPAGENREALGQMGGGENKQRPDCADQGRGSIVQTDGAQQPKIYRQSWMGQ